MFGFVCWLAVFGWLNAVTAQTLTRVRVGGLFSPFTDSGEQDLAQAEHLAAFMMAINEINNHSDGIYDDVLVNAVIRYDVELSTSLETATASFISMQSSFHRRGVRAYVSALGNEESLVIGQLAGAAGVPSLLSVANSGVLNEHSNYPYVVRTVASESRQGMVISNFICQLATKIVVYVSTNDEDIQLLSEFENEASCVLDYMATVLIPGDQVDMTPYAEAAHSTGARYFVLFLPAYQTAALMETGYDVGLFGDNTVIVTTDRGADNITAYFSKGADIADLMTGFYSFQYQPNHYINATTQAKSFAKRWREQDSTAGKMVNGTKVCNNATDSQLHYLYQSTYDNVTFCTGLDFGKYDLVGKKLQPYTTLTYDATIMMLLAMDLLLKDGYAVPNADQVTSYLINNVSGYQGVSGPIDLYAGEAASGYERRGSRVSGTEYQAYNFYPSYNLYSESVEKYFVIVGFYDADTAEYQACTRDQQRTKTCLAATYRSATDGSVYFPPPDAPYPIQAIMSYSFRFVLAILVFMLILEVLLLAGFVCWYRHTKVMKASQPSLLFSILLGGFIAMFRVSSGTSHKNQAGCVTEVWLGHMAFIIMVGSLLVKSYRVHSIVNTRRLRKITFTGTDAFRMLMGIIFITGVYLAFLTVFGQPVLRHVRRTVQNQETVWNYCTLVYPQWQTALYFFEGFLLLFGFRICWEIRNVPDLVNESKQISTAMAGIVLVSVLVLPIVYFLGLPVYTRDFVASFGFAFGAMATLTLLFLPKVINIYCTGGHAPKIQASEIVLPGGNNVASGGNNNNNNASASHRRRNKPGSVGAMTSGTGGESSNSDHAQLNYKFSRELLRHRPRDERLQIVQDQIFGWQTILMHEQRHALDFSSSSEDDRDRNNENSRSFVNNPSPPRDVDSSMLINNLGGGGGTGREYEQSGRSESLFHQRPGSAPGADGTTNNNNSNNNLSNVVEIGEVGGVVRRSHVATGTGSDPTVGTMGTQNRSSNSASMSLSHSQSQGHLPYSSSTAGTSAAENRKMNELANNNNDSLFELTGEGLRQSNASNSRSSTHQHHFLADQQLQQQDSFANSILRSISSSNVNNNNNNPPTISEGAPREFVMSGVSDFET